MDVLALGVRLANLLETGRRGSTYKIAVLTALLQHCIEYADQSHLRADVEGPLHVSILKLADRCIELYWPQVRPFRQEFRLRQVKGGEGRLIPAVTQLREATELRGVRGAHASRGAYPDLYRRTQRVVAHQLAAMPLTHLQRAPGESRAYPFLFDDSWLHKKITLAELDAHSWQIELLPGIALALAQLSSLLVPVLEMLWLSEVRRLNADLFAATDDLADHLFGARRIDLNAVRAPLLELQRGRCFYCDTRVLPGQGHVDHVLPWSRTTLDALGNLVVADPTCNAAKSDLIPVSRHVRRALDRVPDLDQVAKTLYWPVENERVRRVAGGLLAFAPNGLRLWVGRGVFRLLDQHTRETELAALG